MFREGKNSISETKFCDIRDLPSRTSEYAPCDHGRERSGDKPSLRFFFSLAYHSRSVIARSGSGCRQTTCDPVSSTATLCEVASVETENIVMIRRVGARGDDDKSGLTYLRPVVIALRKRSPKRKQNGEAEKVVSEGKPRSAQNLAKTASMLYRDYLKSEHWKKLRATKNKKRCAICGVASKSLDRHHLNYRNLFDVRKSDLRCICRECHDVAHLLLKRGVIRYTSDSHHSRFSRTKNAVKKYRFGSTQISRKDITKYGSNT